MNYRHAYHAGGVADLFKHLILTQLIAQLKLKEAPFRYLDTHAGAGLYDLDSTAAHKTGEFAAGVARLLAAPATPLLAELRGVIESYNADGLRLYPGSPLIAGRLLRPDDRLTLVELRMEDAALLRAACSGDRRCTVLSRDGYSALKGFVPPPERRGLVLIDPPYEAPDEARQLLAALTHAHRRWPHGVYAAWRPIKSRALDEQFLGALVATGIRDMIGVAFLSNPTGPSGALLGSGLVIVNPPWRIEPIIETGLAELAAALGMPEAPTTLRRLAAE